MNRPFLIAGIRVWLMEILVAGVNYFVLMGLIFEPALGEKTAHQIGMTIRIGVIFLFAYLLQRINPRHSMEDLAQVGLLWLVLTLIFEWGGSLIILRRPVSDILVGWHIEKGYMWPYVLAAYLTANLIVGFTLHPERRR